MNTELVFRRQFLLCRTPILGLSTWQCIQLKHFYLYAHQDLEVNLIKDATKTLLLLGYLFNPKDCQSSNHKILKSLISTTSNFIELTHALKPYPGRYVLFYVDDVDYFIIQDALALREVYYCTSNNTVMCGSQPNILRQFARPEIPHSTDPDISDFIQKDLPNIRNGRLWVGDTTAYDNIKHLMPNHYLDINTMTVNRYWPNKELEPIEYDDAVKLACDYLKGTLKAATTRYKVMMAVTAGIDSRSLLAASKDFRNEIYYFINKHSHLNEHSADIRIPNNIFHSINTPFNIHEVEDTIDDEFRTFFLGNTWMAKELLLPAIHNVYFKKHQDKLNLLGVGEIGREYYDAPPKHFDGYYLAWCLKYRDSKFASDECDKWLRSALDIARLNNVDIMKLFLWEMLLGNWGSVGNSESDIAIEEFDPYNSHYIYEIMLSLRMKRTNIFHGMFQEMWPELLNFPFNPPASITDKIKAILKVTGLYTLLKRLKYRRDRRKFLKFHNFIL